jgi:hypothetical protein
MWAAYLQQVFREDPQGKKYDCWILLLRHGSDTRIEKIIRSKHEQIDSLLSEQNVNYSEITTRKGKERAYHKFNFQKGKHPLFLVLNKHPLDYLKNDSLMVIEWGKWSDIEEFRDNLMALCNFFSNEDFRKEIARAKDKKMWHQVGKFLEKHGISFLSIGARVASAIA